MVEDALEAAEVVAVTLAAEAADHLGTKAEAAERIQITTHLQNGTNYPLRNVTRFAKSVTRKENRVEPDDRSAIYLLSSLQR
jgi:hypothetical protein